MKLSSVQSYMIAKAGTTEERPFGPIPLVYKVLGKMYALLAQDEAPLHLSLKCDPDEALFLRDMYTAVSPGYHLNKRHWNTIILDGTIPEEHIYQMIDDSYKLVVAKMTKAQKAELDELASA